MDCTFVRRRAQGNGNQGPLPRPLDFVRRAGAYVDALAKAKRFSGAVLGRWLTVAAYDRSLSLDPFSTFLIPAGKDRFLVSMTGVELRFVRDVQGRVTAVRTLVEGKVVNTTARRQGAPMNAKAGG